MDTLTSDQRTKTMRAVRSRDTKPEVALRKALWRRGLRYRKNYKALPGTPDIALTKYKIAVFVDGDFWHARGHREHPGEQVRTNPAYWQKKLANNVARDRAADETLTELGWLVLRFWASEVQTDLPRCVGTVCRYCGMGR